ncbi:SMP-30/gluconolactonase/LRE family protein [Carboxylicivirga sp. N1Y90]|uniref:SMP-30/gluconolactonase/LRE family protein n=1 Tax=Carboxylicivirga fragile TaxID=3417571 RepID=UPI003D33337B|nr:SMP-30/gluconolactonase/LRE family protein [Marinilabiliaceae bacterium N1Y90]
MNKKLLLATLALILCTSFSQSQNKKSNAIKCGEVEKLASDFKFTEGPAVDAEGNVYFTDIRNHMILIWTIENKLDTFRTESGRANGLYFDSNNSLVVCEGEEGRITSTSTEGKLTILASKFNGQRFNQPNDLWIDPKGGIYFTDPLYGGDDKNIPQDGMHVYYILPDRSSVIRVCNDLKKPNGLIGTPNGKILYVTDAQAGKTFQYNINKNGTLDNKKLFVELGCDGMTIDTKGNLYLTPRGKSSVDIYSSSGHFLHAIEVTERPSNVCFGGKNREQLYITARTSIYRVDINRRGIN